MAVAEAPEPEPTIEKKTSPVEELSQQNIGAEDASPFEEEVPPPPILGDKETQVSESQKDKTAGLIWMVFKQKEIFVALLGIIIVLILMIKLILKKRKQKEFDYTATNIDV